MRLLLPVAASICNDVDVDAKGRLPDRPLEPMLSEMKAHGVTFSQDKPPFTMTGRLQGGNFSMVGDVAANSSLDYCWRPLKSAYLLSQLLRHYNLVIM